MRFGMVFGWRFHGEGQVQTHMESSGGKQPRNSKSLGKPKARARLVTFKPDRNLSGDTIEFSSGAHHATFARVGHFLNSVGN